MSSDNLLVATAAAAALVLTACGGSGGADTGSAGGDAGAPPPSGTGDSSQPMGTEAAARLLTQGTFGPTRAGITAAAQQTYGEWFAEQAAFPASLTLPWVQENTTDAFGRPWWTHAVMAQDQLRQRVAFALSEIMVISAPPDSVNGPAVNQAAYYDVLVRNALGNFRTLLEQVTLNPAMGLFLNMWRNNKADPATGVHADQNYAREVMQLFSIGLVELNLDGTVRTDAQGQPIPTYGQPEVEAMANVLTGWASNPVTHDGEGAWLYDSDYINPMVPYENHHDTGIKTLVGGVVVPAGGSAAADLKIALDTLHRHANVGPFIGKQLIQRLVTSNPSPAYVRRVATVFNDNGQGVRGDLLAVVRAILTDAEAVAPGGTTGGKLREPILRLTHLWRAFEAADSFGTISEYQIVNEARLHFAQQPLRAPSVFNFFVPDYVRAGALADAGLLAPEFQIANENYSVKTANMLMRLCYRFTDSEGRSSFAPNGYQEAVGADSVYLRTAQWEALAVSPQDLIDELNLVFMLGRMPASMRQTLVDYVAGIPESEPAYLAKRAIEAASLVINAPQCAIQY
jgi:uncharacterized protein (DUF1800 family)